MGTRWTVTIDCAQPGRLAEFWALALGYEPAPPPTGFASWTDWFRHFDVPEDEWDEGAYLHDPDGVGPTISFLRVPENKMAKNRMHIDVQAGGGRHTPFEQRWPRVLAAVDRLVAAGATVTRLDEHDGQPDHYEMADPEGNEFCLV